MSTVNTGLFKGSLVVLALLMLAPSSYAMGRRKPPVLDPTPVPTTVPAPTPEFALGEIALAGSGCVGGAGAIELSSDLKNLRIRFDKFAAQAGGADGKTLDRKNCSASIVVASVPANFRVVATHAEILGHHFTEPGALVKLSHETFLAGTVGTKLEEEWGGDAVQAGEIHATQLTEASTGCGETGILRTNTSIVAKKGATEGSAEARIDELSLKLSLEPCVSK